MIRGLFPELELLPRQRDIAEQLPRQPPVAPGTADLQPLRTEAARRAVGVVDREAAVGRHRVHPPGPPLAAVVLAEPHGFAGAQAECFELAVGHGLGPLISRRLMSAQAVAIRACSLRIPASQRSTSPV